MPGLVPSATDDHHATFVIDGAAGPVAVLDLLQGEGHLELLHLVAPDLEHARALHDFAEAAARALRAREIRLRPGAMSDEQSRALGYRNGVKRVAADGVPLWRDGVAPFSQSLYYRGTWAALALLTGLGSVSIAVFSGGGITLAHIVIPALLCIVGTLFALWQILLVVMAARRALRIALRPVGCNRRDHGPADRLAALRPRLAGIDRAVEHPERRRQARRSRRNRQPRRAHPVRLGPLWHAQRGDGAQGAGAAQVAPRGRARRGRADAPRRASRSSA